MEQHSIELRPRGRRRKVVPPRITKQLQSEADQVADPANLGTRLAGSKNTNYNLLRVAAADMPGFKHLVSTMLQRISSNGGGRVHELSPHCKALQA